MALWRPWSSGAIRPALVPTEGTRAYLVGMIWLLQGWSAGPTRRRRAGIADGTIRPDAAPGEVAVEVVGQLRGIGLQRLLDPQAVDIERLHHTVTEHWRRALSVRQT